ncbi:hypothetical protein BsWGS_10087 [Bradybaena similaris]
MEPNLTKEQISEYKELFEAMDKNGDGVITSNELDDAMRALGQIPTAAELKKMIDKADIDGNGKVDFREFSILMSRQKKYTSKEEELRDVFKFVDFDGNGSISVDELQQMMVNLGERVTREQVQEMIREIDLDGDGQIDCDEFVKIMLPK